MARFLSLVLQYFETFKKNVRHAFSWELFTSSTLWTLVLIFCCLLLTTFISYRSTKELIGDNAWVLHTQEVLTEVLEISTNVRAAEGRQRGYILTNQPEYLQRYGETIIEVNKHLQTLKQLVIDNPVRVDEVNRLESLIAKRTSQMDEVLRTYKNEGEDKGRQKLINGGGLTVMREIVLLTEKLEVEEKQLLKQRTISSLNSRNFALRGLVIGGVFTTALVFFAYYLLLNDLRRRQQTAKELAEARDSLEAKVLERTEELEQSNRELQEFAYIASHDLQEPLRKIQVFGDRLKNKSGDKLDETGRDYLERIQNAAKRMQTLINDLLQFSRISSNSTTEEFVQVDLNCTIQEVLNDLEGSLEHYGGKVCVDALPVIKGNPLQIGQLLQNMLSNALKFQRKNVPPEISVIWQQENKISSVPATGKFIEIAITDNGIGIDPQYVDKIFVPFQRLHGKTEYEGTGIGLAVCRKIIEKHHGYIHVLPAPNGQGTTFVLGFPSN